MCTMLETAWITLQCTERIWCLGARRQTLQQGTGCLFSELWPCLLPRLEWSSSVSCGSFDSSLCSEHSALRLATSLSRCFLCWPVTTKYWTETFFFLSMQRWQRTRQQRRPAQTVWPVEGRNRSQPTCLYYIVLTKSLCLTPFSSIAMEKPCWCMYLTSVQMHLFEKENETLTYL